MPRLHPLAPTLTARQSTAFDAQTAALAASQFIAFGSKLANRIGG